MSKLLTLSLDVSASSAYDARAELLRRGASAVAHSRRTLLEHLSETARILERWHQTAHVQLAGLFHSVYSTDAFSPALFDLSERDLVCRLIGSEAERLVYLFCVIERRDLFSVLKARPCLCDPIQLQDRAIRNSEVELSTNDIGELLAIYLANEAEQTSRRDGSPDKWLTPASQFGAWLSNLVDEVPPVFNFCRAVVTHDEETRLLESYDAATHASDPLSPVVERDLLVSAEAAPWVAEPFIRLGLIALASGWRGSPTICGERALAIIDAWGTPWDKRLSCRQWAMIATLLSTAERNPNGRQALLSEGVRAALSEASEPASLWEKLGDRGLLDGIDATGGRPSPSIKSDIAQRAIIPQRFARYVSGFSKDHDSPLMTIYPDLKARPWHDAATFALARDLELRAPEIIAEFLAIDPEEFHVESEPIERRGRWDVFMLFERGRRHADNCRRCPVTADVIERHKTVRSLAGLAYFSRLAPGSAIAEHRGPTNMRLRCHLGITVPSDCGITVAGVTREWQTGRCIVFDDSFPHKVWNLANAERVVLIVDVWHPDLTDEEIGLLEGLHRYVHAQTRQLSSYWTQNDRVRAARQMPVGE